MPGAFLKGSFFYRTSLPEAKIVIKLLDPLVELLFLKEPIGRRVVKITH
jgi:hypothetical protein